MNFQIVKIFRNKPSELLSNNHYMEEAKLICEKYYTDLILKQVDLSTVEYLLAYQAECKNCKNNFKNN